MKALILAAGFAFVFVTARFAAFFGRSFSSLRTIFASLPPLLAEVRADLGLSAGAAGLLTTLPVVCLGALAPLAPRLARRPMGSRSRRERRDLVRWPDGLHPGRKDLHARRRHRYARRA